MLADGCAKPVLLQTKNLSLLYLVVLCVAIVSYSGSKCVWVGGVPEFSVRGGKEMTFLFFDKGTRSSLSFSLSTASLYLTQTHSLSFLLYLGMRYKHRVPLEGHTVELRITRVRGGRGSISIINRGVKWDWEYALFIDDIVTHKAV